MANIPMLYKFLKQKKVGGCLGLIFGAETNFGDFRSDNLGEYDAHMQNGFSLLIRDIYRVD
jgi:hypothetical protein